jgi:hypothetical protein
MHGCLRREDRVSQRETSTGARVFAVRGSRFAERNVYKADARVFAARRPRFAGRNGIRELKERRFESAHSGWFECPALLLLGKKI